VTRALVLVPRYRWSVVHSALQDGKAEFSTLRNTCTDSHSGAVEVVTGGRGVAILRRLGLSPNGRRVPVRDVWPDPEGPLEARGGVSVWARGPKPTDALEAAFRAYQRRVRGAL
jgi:DNA-binding transcriptional LysR family regulator